MNVSEYIKKESEKSRISTLLFQKLREIIDNLNNICGIFAELKTDKERQQLLNYINEGKDVNEEQLILTSIWIAQQNNK